MKKIVALLGDQAAPLLLLCASVKEVFEVHILTTPERREKAEYVRVALQSFAQVKQQYIHEVAYNDMTIITAVAIEIIGDGDEVLVDITGGTKLMSLGLFAAANGSKARILYVDTAGGVILDITKPQCRELFCKEFKQPIPYKTIFRAYGKEAREQPDKFEEDELRALMDYISTDVTRWAEFWKWYVSLLRNRTQQQTNIISIGVANVDSKNKQVLQFLQKKGFVSLSKKRDKDYFTPVSVKVADYLRKGSWLEDLVHYKLYRHFTEVRKNVGILVPKPQEQIKEGEFPWYSENEVDVLVNQNGLLLFIECKAGQGKNVVVNIAKELPKIEAVSEKNAGFFAKRAIVLPYARDNVTAEFLAKATRARITVFCIEEISQLEQHVATLLGYGKNMEV